MTEAEAQEFALEWIAAWNSHDLDRILTHYADDVEVTSPLVETVLGPGKVTVRGKAALRAYWRQARPRGSYLFPGATPDRPRSRDAAQRVLRQVAAQCGLGKRITPHTLRHCFATHILGPAAFP